MALSSNTQEQVDEAISHIRAALRSAAVNDSSSVSLSLAKVMNNLEMMKHSEQMSDKIEKMMEESGGDNPFKGFL